MHRESVSTTNTQAQQNVTEPLLQSNNSINEIVEQIPTYSYIQTKRIHSLRTPTFYHFICCSTRDRGAKYCDDRLSVCLSVIKFRNHLYENFFRILHRPTTIYSDQLPLGRLIQKTKCGLLRHGVFATNHSPFCVFHFLQKHTTTIIRSYWHMFQGIMPNYPDLVCLKAFTK